MEESISALLESYGFELAAGETPQTTATRWLAATEAAWVRLAILEALHQGRYKAISVEQILRAWQRRGTPACHFTPDFERFICQNLPRRHPAKPERRSPEPPGEIAAFQPDPDLSELHIKLQEAARQEALSEPLEPLEEPFIEIIPEELAGDLPHPETDAEVAPETDPETYPEI